MFVIYKHGRVIGNLHSEQMAFILLHRLREKYGFETYSIEYTNIK